MFNFPKQIGKFRGQGYSEVKKKKIIRKQNMDCPKASRGKKTQNKYIHNQESRVIGIQTECFALQQQLIFKPYSLYIDKYVQASEAFPPSTSTKSGQCSWDDCRDVLPTEPMPRLLEKESLHKTESDLHILLQQSQYVV